MAIIINTDPIEIQIGETVFLMQRDPTATKAWDTLLEIEKSYIDPKQRDKAVRDLKKALSDMAETPEDAEKIKGLDPKKVGLKLLSDTAEDYAKTVTGFPTGPSSDSPNS